LFSLYRVISSQTKHTVKSMWLLLILSLGTIIVGVALILLLGQLFLWYNSSLHRALIQEASCLDTAQERLRLLSEHPAKVVRCTVAKTPNAPAALLIFLAGEFPREVLDNPAFALVLIEHPDFFDRVPAQFWLHPQLPSRQIALGAIHHRQEIRTLIAQRKYLPFPVKKTLLCQPGTWWYASQSLSFLQRLSLYYSRESALRAAVAPTMPRYWFPRLLKDPTWEVRLAALRHPYITPSQLQALASDPDYHVRMAVAQHQVTPQGALEKLKRDERPEVRNAVLPRTRRV
jgi:hypothetical protein